MKTFTTALSHQVIPYFFVLLLTYAAASKLLDFENFQIQIGQSPVLSAYAGFISYGIIAIELLVSVLLCFPKLRLTGLYISLGLMTGFTVYIYIILNYSEFIPCSCGGILEKLGWQEHLIFNTGCILLATAGIWLIEKAKNKLYKTTILYITLVSILASSSIIYLFISSEHIIRTENNFTRRFPHHGVLEDKNYELKYNSFYFAGYDEHFVYLGNYTAPFLLTKVDINLRSSEQQILNPEHYNSYKWSGVKIKVSPPYVYLYDGKTPIIYRSEIGNNDMKMISHQDAYFDELAPIEGDHFVLRAKSTKTNSNTLGLLDVLDARPVSLRQNSLDGKGVFETDGQLIYNPSERSIIYVYYYKNQFTVSDETLNRKTVYHTIDTISTPKIKVVEMTTGIKKMAAPPLIVNSSATVQQHILFIKSNIIGKYELKKTWNKASVVDMYHTQRKEYLGSFYVDHRGDDKMRQMLATDQYFYTLTGSRIVRYRYAHSISKQFKRESRKPLQE